LRRLVRATADSFERGTQLDDGLFVHVHDEIDADGARDLVQEAPACRDEARPLLLANGECPHFRYCDSRVARKEILGQRSMVSSRFTRDGAR
jgi:hypothetical protein